MIPEEIENHEHPDLALQIELYNSLSVTMDCLRVQFLASGVYGNDDLAWRHYVLRVVPELSHALELLDAYKILALRPKHGK